MRNLIRATFNLLYHTNIDTYDDYCEWVQKWRKHLKTIEANIYFTKDKKRVHRDDLRFATQRRTAGSNIDFYSRVSQSSDPTVNEAVTRMLQSERDVLGNCAKYMHELRVTNKTRLHEGAWPRPERQPVV